jgi:hypothetical protein
MGAAGGGAVGGGGAGAAGGSSDCAYRTEVIGDGPIAYWRFDETPGSTMAVDELDAYSGSYHGVTLGEPSAVGATCGPSVYLNGTGYVSVEDASALDFAGMQAFTVEAWVRQDNAVGNQDVVSKYGGAGPFLGYSLAATSSAVTFRRFEDDPDAAASSEGLPNGAWTHIVGVYDGTNQRLYIDGIQAAIDGSSMPMDGNASPLVLGCKSLAPETGGCFMGGLDEVAIYSTALGADRIAAHFAAASR